MTWSWRRRIRGSGWIGSQCSPSAETNPWMSRVWTMALYLSPSGTPGFGSLKTHMLIPWLPGVGQIRLLSVEPFDSTSPSEGALPTNPVLALGVGRLGHAVMVALGDAVPHPEAVAVPDHDGVPRGVPLPGFVVTQDLFAQHRPVLREFGAAHLVDEIPVQKKLTVGADVDDGFSAQQRQ